MGNKELFQRRNLRPTHDRSRDISPRATTYYYFLGILFAPFFRLFFIVQNITFQNQIFGIERIIITENDFW